VKRHPDPDRYYRCRESGCNGQLIQIGNELTSKKSAIYECSKCGARPGEASLLMAYNELRRHD
jgi:DNA-directed RNA polymerase subunit RPC12/RpoP